MKCLQRQKGLSMLSMCIGLSIAVLSYTSACAAEPEILMRAQKSLNIVHVKSNMNVDNVKQKSINVEKRCTQKGQLLTSKEISSLGIREKDNSELLQLRAGEGGGNTALATIGAVFLVLILIAGIASANAEDDGNPPD